MSKKKGFPTISGSLSKRIFHKRPVNIVYYTQAGLSTLVIKVNVLVPLGMHGYNLST